MTKTADIRIDRTRLVTLLLNIERDAHRASVSASEAKNAAMRAEADADKAIEAVREMREMLTAALSAADDLSDKANNQGPTP